MDEYDTRATQELSDRHDLWVRDSIYPGSCVLTEAGRKECDRLAVQYRRLAVTDWDVAEQAKAAATIQRNLTNRERQS